MIHFLSWHTSVTITLHQLTQCLYKHTCSTDTSLSKSYTQYIQLSNTWLLVTTTLFKLTHFLNWHKPIQITYMMYPSRKKTLLLVRLTYSADIFHNWHTSSTNPLPQLTHAFSTSTTQSRSHTQYIWLSNSYLWVRFTFLTNTRPQLAQNFNYNATTNILP